MGALTVRQKLQQFYRDNNFDLDGGTSTAIVWIKLWLLPVPVFNLKSRKTALFFHDLHHVTTGYPTTLRGEAEISAWELGAGGWGRLWYVWVIVLSGMALGVVFFPTATRKAYHRGQSQTNAYVLGIPATQMQNLPVQDVIEQMSHKNGQVKPYWYWAVVSVCLIAIPALIACLACYMFFIA